MVYFLLIPWPSCLLRKQHDAPKSKFEQRACSVCACAGRNVRRGSSHSEGDCLCFPPPFHRLLLHSNNSCDIKNTDFCLPNDGYDLNVDWKNLQLLLEVKDDAIVDFFFLSFSDICYSRASVLRVVTRCP